MLIDFISSNSVKVCVCNERERVRERDLPFPFYINACARIYKICCVYTDESFCTLSELPEAVSVTVIGIYYWCIYNQCTNSTSQHHTVI